MASAQANAKDKAATYLNQNPGGYPIHQGIKKSAAGNTTPPETAGGIKKAAAEPVTETPEEFAPEMPGDIKKEGGGEEQNPVTGGAAGESIQDGQTPGAEGLYGGITNYADISEKFQSWNPTSDWGKSMQATYMMNTLQNFNDMQQAESMAFTNAGIQMDMMTAQAALELANKGALLDAEQKAALNMMGAQFDYESRFAQDEYNREVGAATLGTDLQIQLMQAQGDQTRANYQVQGFEERMGQMEAGEQERLTQAQANIEAQQQAAQANELSKDNAAFTQGLQKDSAAYMQGLGMQAAEFNQALDKDSAAFNQALQKDTEQNQSDIRKDEATYGSNIRQDEARLGSELRSDEARLGSDLRSDEARLGSDLRSEEAVLGSGLRSDEARLGSELRSNEAILGSQLRSDEAILGSGLRKDEAAFGSGLRKDEADYANRLEARTRADMAKRSVGRARGF